MKDCLLLVDIQNDYFPGGKMELVEPVAATLNAKKLLNYFRKNSKMAVFIQHIAIKPNATFFLPDTEGINIHPLVEPLEEELIFQKHYPNSFRETGLLETLRENKIERLIICGMMTHMCIDTTVRAAFDLGFEVIVAQDACTTKALKFDGQICPADIVHYSFMSALQGSFASVSKTGDILKLLRTKK
jgi:nicotinamidase-related amidase